MTITIKGSNTPTAGGIGYGNGDDLAFTAAGTSGQVLVSAGSSAPSWQDAVTGLQWQAVQTANFNCPRPHRQPQCRLTKS